MTRLSGVSMRSISCRIVLCALILIGNVPGLASAPPDAPVHGVVYYEPGKFAAHPANIGMWNWDNEILVGFRLWEFLDRSQEAVRNHSREQSKGYQQRFARSLDGGATWTVEVPTFVDGSTESPKPIEPHGGLDFMHPDVAIQFRSSVFLYSNDRGRTWQGPYQLPNFGFQTLQARTDYIVDGKHELRAFLTVTKANNREGRVICVRTTDGGKTWTLLGHVGPEPEGFSIMSQSERLSPTRILTTIRRKEGETHWVDAWVSDDNGVSWKWLSRPAPSTGGAVGNPAALQRLRDGRLAVVYGYRSSPYGMRARLSSNDGRTWGEEIVLRNDAGNWDLGYPLMIERPDGKLVITYYFNFLYEWDVDRPHPGPAAPGREPYVAYTIWDPGTAQEGVTR